MEVLRMEKIQGDVTVKFNLKKLIHKRGLTYEEFGSRFEPVMAKGTVSRLSKANGITFDRLAQIVEALNISEEELTELITIYKK